MSSDHDNNGKAIKINVWINEERLEALANAGWPSWPTRRSRA